MTQQNFLKYLSIIFALSTTLFVVANNSVLPDEEFQNDKGIILFDEKNSPLDLVYLPMNLKPYLHVLRSYCEKEQSISQALQDFIQAITQDFESIPKESAQQAIQEIVDIVSRNTSNQNEELINVCRSYQEMLQSEENPLVLTPQAVVKGIKDNQVFRTATVLQCLQAYSLVVCTDALINRNLRVKNNLTVTGNETVQGNLTVEGSLVVNGGQAIVGPIVVDGDVTINGNEVVNGNITAVDITATGNFLASDNSYTFTSDLGSGMHHPALSTLTFTTDSVTRLEIDPAGTVTIPATTGTSNALVVEGNINTAAAVFTGGSTSCADGQSALVLNGTSDTNATLVVTQNCPAGNALDVTGDVFIDGDVTLTGSLSIGSLQFLAGDGTAASPSYSFLSDTNTGIYHPATNTLGISTEGVQRLSINGDGTVTINAAAAGANSLVVNGGSNATTATIINTNTGTALNVSNTFTGNALEATGTVNINTSGGSNTNIGNSAGGGAVNIDAGAASHFITTAGTLTFNATGGVVIDNAAGSGATTIGSATSRINLPGLPTGATSPGRAVILDGSDNVNTLTFTNINTANTLAWRDANGNLQVTDPIADQDAASKSYVDAFVRGLNLLAPVRVVATTPLVLSGSQVIDSVTVVAGDRVLAAGQGGAPGTAHIDNGVWVVQVGAWTRPADYACGQASQGDAVLVEEGTVYSGTTWVAVTPAPNDIICTDAIAWQQLSSPTAATGNNVGTGSGLVFKNQTGNVLNFRTLNQANHILIDTDTTAADTVTIQTDATSANTVSTIVARDAAGGFSAGAISAMTVSATGNITSTTGNITATAGNVTGVNIVASSGDISASLGNISAGGSITAGTRFLAGAGSTAAPAYSFTADSNTGIYNSTADELSISTAGTQRMSVNSTGTVAINAATSGNSLAVAGTTASSTETVTNSNAAGTALSVSNTGGGTALTVSGTSTVTGTTNINTSGTANTTIGNTGGGTVTITPATLNLPNITNTNISSGLALYLDGSENVLSEQFTNANTANTIVARDASGNFSAGTITANINGSISGGTISGTNISASGQFLAADGTAGAPSYSFTSDATNGMYLAAADTIGFSTAGTQRMSINSAGTVAINALGAGVMNTNGSGVVSSTATTDNAVQVGNAAGTLSSLAVGTNGQVLIGATGADPAFATLTSTGGTITFTPGANSLNLEAGGGTVATSYATDSGTATPSGGTLTIAGGTNINTSGAGSTVTVNLDASPSVTNLTASGQFLAANGTAGTPSYSFTNDATTGMYLPAAGTLGFSSAGAQRMSIDSSGTVTVNASAAGTNSLIVSGSTTVPTETVTNSGTGTTLTVTNTNVGAASALSVTAAGTAATEIISNTGSGSALTATANVSAPTVQITGNSTTTAPALRLLNNPASVATDFSLTIDASGNVKQSAGTAGSVASSFVTDSGTATPSSNIINILGGTNIGTTGAGNTVTINLDNNVTLTPTTGTALTINGATDATAQTITAGSTRSALSIIATADAGVAVNDAAVSIVNTTNDGSGLFVNNSGGGNAINATIPGTAAAINATCTGGGTAIVADNSNTGITASFAHTGATGNTVNITHAGATAGNALEVTGGAGATATTITAGTNQTALSVTGNGSATAATIAEPGGSTGTSLSVTNAGSGTALNVDARAPGTGPAAVINGNATSTAVTIGSTDIPAQRALLVQSAATTATLGGAAITVINSGTGTALNVDNTSTGNSVNITHTGASGDSLSVTNSGSGVGVNINVSGAATGFGLTVTGNEAATAATITNGGPIGLQVTNTSTLFPTLRLVQNSSTLSSYALTAQGNMSFQPLTLSMNNIGTITNTGGSTNAQCIVTGSGTTDGTGLATIPFAGSLSSFSAFVATAESLVDINMTVAINGVTSTSLDFMSWTTAGAAAPSIAFRYVVVGTPI